MPTLARQPTLVLAAVLALPAVLASMLVLAPMLVPGQPLAAPAQAPVRAPECRSGRAG